MSQVDLSAALRRLVAQMHEVGYSTAQIITLIVGEAPTKVTAPAAVPVAERLISVELASGVTKQYPWTPELQAQVDRDAKAKAQAPAPAPKRVALQEHEIVFTPSRSTTHDAQVASYKEPWTGPSAAAEIDDSEDVDFDALIRETESDLAKMRAMRGKQ